MKNSIYTIAAFLLAFLFVQCGGGDSEGGDSDTTQADTTEAVEESKVITEPINDTTVTQGMFIKEPENTDYTYRYSQIGAEYINGGYTAVNDTLGFDYGMYINFNVESCEKGLCMDMTQEKRDAEAERMTNWYNDTFKEKAQFIEATAEEIEIDGKKAHLFVRKYWLTPQSPKDTVENKKFEVEIYYHNGNNRLEVTAFPYGYRNLSQEEWDQLVSKETLTKHATEIFKMYSMYF